MHAKPCTDSEGRASLSFTDGAKAAYWSPERIAGIAHAFEEASGEANDLCIMPCRNPSRDAITVDVPSVNGGAEAAIDHGLSVHCRESMRL